MLKKSCMVLIVIVGLASIVPAFQNANAWQTFSSREGRFSVLMPSEPKGEVKDVDSVVGKLTLYSYSSSTKAAYLMAAYGDYPKEPGDAANVEEVLDGVVAGVLKGFGGEKLSINKIILKRSGSTGMVNAEYSGREFTGKRIHEGSEIFFSWKVYLVGRRLYQLGAVTSGADMNSPEIQRFLSSFQLAN